MGRGATHQGARCASASRQAPPFAACRRACRRRRCSTSGAFHEAREREGEINERDLGEPGEASTHATSASRRFCCFRRAKPGSESGANNQPQMDDGCKQWHRCASCRRNICRVALHCATRFAFLIALRAPPAPPAAAAAGRQRRGRGWRIMMTRRLIRAEHGGGASPPGHSSELSPPGHVVKISQTSLSRGSNKSQDRRGGTFHFNVFGGFLVTSMGRLAYPTSSRR